MIKIDRYKIDKPAFFYSKEYERLQQEISDFYGMHKNSRAQRSYTIGNFYSEIASELVMLFDAKCAYCESYLLRLKSGYQSYVNHFRPSNNAQGFDSKDIDADHYWWLTYEWENLYACCHSCNRHKSNVFPVQGKRAAIKTSHQEIAEKENAFLIDPCVDEPSQFFTFNIETYEIIPLEKANSLSFSNIKFTPVLGEMIKQKAEATIQILGLNRRDLIYERQIIADQMKSQVNDLQKGVKNARAIAEEWNEVLAGTSTKNHLAFRKALIDNYLKDKEIAEILFHLTDQMQSYFDQIQQQQQSNPAAQEQIKGGGNILDNITISNSKGNISFSGNVLQKESSKTEEDNTFDTSLLRNVYLDSIELKNFKCFSNLTLKLPSYADDTSRDTPWLVFLGENGVGKSSVLKAIAIALMGQEYIDLLGIEVGDILKYGKQSGHIKVFGKDNDEVYTVNFSKKKNEIVASIQKPPAFIIGYGSTRLLPIGNLQPEKEHPSYLKVKNLFDSSVSLSNAKEWFLNTNRKTFNEVSITLKKLLLLDDLDSVRRSIKNKQIFIKYHQTGDVINIDHLSDGYKSIFAVAIDMIYTLSQENIVYELAEGIVLIDEIGTHLHPRWKMEIVERLRNTFKKIQFLITTHEPLCLRGLKENEVVVLKRDEDNAIIALSELPDPSSLRIDQLLTSEYFGLNSTMDVQTELLFKEYYELLAIDKADRTEEQQTTLEALQEDVKKIKYMRFGNDKREEIIYQVVDELLAKNMRNKDLKIDVKDIKQEAIDRVKQLWKKLEQKQ